MGIRAIHWLKEGKRVKYQEVTEFKQIDSIWVATQRTMKTTKNKKTTHKTVLKWDNIKFNQDLDESMFSVRRLEKGI